MYNIRKLSTWMRSRALVWDIITTTGWSTLGKGVGFLIPFFIAAWFGITAETDAFFFVYGLILFLSDIFASVLENVIVPYIAEIRSKNEEDVSKFVGNILSLSGLGILAVLALFLFVFRLILPLVTKFNPASLKLIYLLLIEASPLVLFLVWTSVLAGTLNTYKKFIFPAISPAIRAIVCIGIIYVFKERLGVQAVVLGYVTGEIIRFVILAGIIRRLNIFKLRFYLQFNPKLWEFLKTLTYQIISMVAVGFNPIIDRIMASWLTEGSVSLLYYADRLYMIPVTFMTGGLTVVILSHWSSHFYNSAGTRLRQDVRKAAKKVVIITIPVSVILITFNRILVNIALARGVFDRARLPEIYLVCVGYLLGLVPYVWYQIYVKGLLVMKNTKVLMKCACFMVLLNIIFNLILMKYFKTAGLALATSLVSVFALVYLGRNFYKLTKNMQV